ncbi:CRAL-TRIO domain-containing protein [Nemania sp. NC0429]|nr:CRAL-TRIO domain-containing protein [Nemania sp. NC0429]
MAEAGENVSALPGRPGNLTPEQEEKLRKFWEMFLQICGVLDEDGVDGDTNVPSEQGKAAVAGSDKPKKKTLNPFKKRKDKSKESKSAEKDAAESTAAVKENDPEDKWGETKAYHETLAKHPPEEIRATIWAMVKHDNPDALLLRFLRARKWDLQRALVMMVSTMNWRASEMRVESDVVVNGEEHASIDEGSSDEAVKERAEDFLAQMRIGKSYCYGIDKAGRPICVCRARLHRAGEQSESSLERYTVYLIETTRFLLSPPVDTACVVFDLTGFSLANMDYSPVKFMIKCFEANYPESLGAVLVHKAPWVFQGVWRIIRGWLDPVVASKVHFTNNVKDLEEFIAKDKLPDEMDGTSGWSYKYIEPIPGENDKMKDTDTRDKLIQERKALYEEFESKTIEWIREDDATKRAALNSERSAIAHKLREQYWRLDPYIRSRTLYDRIGVIKPNGSLDYYPAWEAVGTSNGAAAVAEAAVETSSDDVD